MSEKKKKSIQDIVKATDEKKISKKEVEKLAKEIAGDEVKKQHIRNLLLKPEDALPEYKTLPLKPGYKPKYKKLNEGGIARAKTDKVEMIEKEKKERFYNKKQKELLDMLIKEEKNKERERIKTKNRKRKKIKFNEGGIATVEEMRKRLEKRKDDPNWTVDELEWQMKVPDEFKGLISSGKKSNIESILEIVKKISDAPKIGGKPRLGMLGKMDIEEAVERITEMKKGGKVESGLFNFPVTKGRKR